jgi:hypothetical protein
MSQMSLFAAGMNDPSYDDLEGLLVGLGTIERRDDAARVSIGVADDWRAQVMLRALAVLGPGAEVSTTPQGLEVRTAYVPELYDLAERWHSFAGKHPPAGLRLDGARLWWWCVAAGTVETAGYRLGLGAADSDAVWSAAGAALAAAGVPAALVGHQRLSAHGPAYRVVGARRLVRLAELVGAAPHGVPVEAWPSPGRGHGLVGQGPASVLPGTTAGRPRVDPADPT